MSETKRIVIELHIPMEVEVPADWDEKETLFFYNDSSHCIGNELKTVMARLEEQGECGCMNAMVTIRKDTT